MTGIWGRIEFPAVKTMTDVDWVLKVNEDSSLTEVFWRRRADELKGWLGKARPPKTETSQVKRPMLSGESCEQLNNDFYDQVDW